MSHLVPVSCVPGVLAMGLAVYLDEDGGMSHVVCETLLGSARLDVLGWQASDAEMSVDLDNPDTRDRVLWALGEELMAAAGWPRKPAHRIPEVPRFRAYFPACGGRSAELVCDEATFLWFERPTEIGPLWRSCPALRGATDHIAALAAVCRGPR